MAAVHPLDCISPLTSHRQPALLSQPEAGSEMFAGTFEGRARGSSGWEPRELWKRGKLGITPGCSDRVVLIPH